MSLSQYKQDGPLFEFGYKKEEETKKYLRTLYEKLKSHKVFKQDKRKIHYSGRELISNFIEGFIAYFTEKQKPMLYRMTPLEIIAFYAGLYEETFTPGEESKIESVEKVSHVVGKMHKKYQLGPIKEYEEIKEKTYSTKSGDMKDRLKQIKDRELKSALSSIPEISFTSFLEKDVEKRKSNLIKKAGRVEEALIYIFSEKIEYILYTNKNQSNPPLPPKYTKQENTK